MYIPDWTEDEITRNYLNGKDLFNPIGIRSVSALEEQNGIDRSDESYSAFKQDIPKEVRSN